MAAPFPIVPEARTSESAEHHAAEPRRSHSASEAKFSTVIEHAVDKERGLSSRPSTARRERGLISHVPISRAFSSESATKAASKDAADEPAGEESEGAEMLNTNASNSLPDFSCQLCAMAMPPLEPPLRDFVSNKTEFYAVEASSTGEGLEAAGTSAVTATSLAASKETADVTGEILTARTESFSFAPAISIPARATRLPDSEAAPVDSVSIPDGVHGADSNVKSAQPELPRLPDSWAKNSQWPRVSSAVIALPEISREARRGNASAGLSTIASGPITVEKVRGIAAAKPLARMETSSNSEPAAASAEQNLPGRENRAAKPLDLKSEISNFKSDPAGVGEREDDFPADAVVQKDPIAGMTGATDWLMGRPVSTVDRPNPELPHPMSREQTDRVEQISHLLSRESALVKQHNGDSMAVILRPDPHTELFVHLTKNNGHVEVLVRCERGDFQQLNQLWTQLQESLVPQRVRLSPLQETGGDSSHAPFSYSGEPTANGGEQQPRRQFSEEELLADRPASAFPIDKRSVSPRESGERLTTSRPGWETWA